MAASDHTGMTSGERGGGAGRASPWPLVAICVGYFMVILDTMVVNVALPALSAGLRTTTTGLEWVVDAYSLVFAALLLSAGALGDRRGAKTVFGVGIALFALASLACGMASSTAALIAARVAQGLGAALAVPSSLALLQAAYPERAARRRAFGIWGGVAGIAAGAGPVVGGALVSGLGWRSVFFLNVPIGAAALALAARVLPAPTPRPHGVDPAGQAAGIAALGGLALALIEAGSAGWASPVVIGGLSAFVVAGGAFVLVERRASDPMLPLGLFSSATFSAATVVGLLINLGFYGELFVMSLYLQTLRGFSPLLAGIGRLAALRSGLPSPPWPSLRGRRRRCPGSCCATPLDAERGQGCAEEEDAAGDGHPHPKAGDEARPVGDKAAEQGHADHPADLAGGVERA